MGLILFRARKPNDSSAAEVLSYTCLTFLPRFSGFSCSHSSLSAAKMESATKIERPRLQTRVMA